jgi:hypothetical protein
MPYVDVSKRTVGKSPRMDGGRRLLLVLVVVSVVVVEVVVELDILYMIV